MNLKEVERGLGYYLRESRLGFVQIFVFSGLINILMLVSPIFMLQIYDRVITSRSQETLISLTAISLFLIAFVLFMEISRVRISSRIGFRLSEKLSSNIFSRLFSIEGPAGKRNIGSTPLRHLNTIRRFISEPPIFALFDSPWAPFYVFIVFLLHPYMGMVSLAGVIVIFSLAVIGEIISRGQTGETITYQSRSMRTVDSCLRNAEVVLAMNLLPGLQKKWQSTESLASVGQVLSQDKIAIIAACSKTFRLMLQIMILAVGGYLVLIDQLSPGAMIAGSILMGRALAPVEQSIGAWRGFIGARMAWSELNDIVKQLPSTEDDKLFALPRPAGLLEIQSISVQYGTKTILNDMSFNVNPGDSVALVGPSGCGKTTLLQLLAGVRAPDSGSIQLDKVVVDTWNIVDRGQYIGYLPQDVELFNGTIAENISRFQDVPDQSIIDAAKLAGCHDLIAEMPENYATLVGGADLILSGGQKQRIGLARAVFGNPAVLLLDEPNSNLDGEGEQQLINCVQALKKNSQTVIAVTHGERMLSAFDKILYINQGVIRAYGERDHILAQLQSSGK